MSSDPLICDMLAARQLIRNVNPDLLVWARQRWRDWQLRQKRTREGARSRLVIVAAISCVDDLLIHVGLMQLLGRADLQATVVLTLPTHESARLVRAQARRDEWEMLIHILAEAECEEKLRKLPGSEPLIVFPTAVLLPAQACAAVADLIGDAIGPLADTAEEYFMGRAADYVAWTKPTHRALGQHLSATTREILSLDPKNLGPASDDFASAPVDATPVDCKNDWKLDGGALQIPLFGPSDELVISVLSENRPAAKIVHRNGHFCDGELKVRAPAAMLTTTAQRIRIEVPAANNQGLVGEFSFRVPPHDLKPWMMSAFLNRGGAGNPVIRAFAEAIGCRIAYAEDEPETLSDIPVVWGVLRGSDRILRAAEAQQLYFFYIDHAYFNRGHGERYRITRNGYEAGAVRSCPANRWEASRIPIKPWRKSGREIIVCPPTEYFMKAHDCSDWLPTTLSTLESLTDRPIIVRQKPKPGDEAVPLETALETAHALVTHSSNVAIEAACLGTPVFVAPTSAAAPVGRIDLADIEMPIYPDREPWLAHLAYNQFSFEEIRSGEAWRMLLELEERDFV